MEYLENIHNTARPHGRAMGCLLWVHAVCDIIFISNAWSTVNTSSLYMPAVVTLYDVTKSWSVYRCPMMNTSTKFEIKQLSGLCGNGLCGTQKSDKEMDMHTQTRRMDKVIPLPPPPPPPPSPNSIGENDYQTRNDSNSHNRSNISDNHNDNDKIVMMMKSKKLQWCVWSYACTVL